VIGSGDRALERKACDSRPSRTTFIAPRVIALQNRMRLTQSPRRAPHRHILNCILGRAANIDTNQPTKMTRHALDTSRN